jgi:Amt family ammonium transporter
MKHGKPSVLGGLSGAVAGLVAITPASGFVAPMPALLIGLAAGFVCYFMVAIVKMRFGYDDSLDAFGIHGVGGTLGAVLTGVFASSAVNNGLKDAAGNPVALGMIEGNMTQVLNQIVGSGIAIAIAIVGTLIALKAVDLVIGVRADHREEQLGLDLAMHGEEAYNFEA